MSPLLLAWDAALGWLSDVWGWFDGSYFSAAWGWFDGSYFSAAWGWFDGSYLTAAGGLFDVSYFSAAWGWFDGSWLSAPWVFAAGMLERGAESVASVDGGMTDDEASEQLSEVDLSGVLSWVTWPYYRLVTYIYISCYII